METKFLTSCSTIQQAYMLRDILMGEGIGCILTNEAQSTLYPGLNFTEPEIWVDEKDYDKAYAIYQDVINGQASISEE
ncbi:MAG: DUF2007 domain-containing protein [Bacteroidales bacterium]|nr:DUF2007 domain-containing protein [Bacteroidales bacterium]